MSMPISLSNIKEAIEITKNLIELAKTKPKHTVVAILGSLILTWALLPITCENCDTLKMLKGEFVPEIDQETSWKFLSTSDSTTTKRLLLFDSKTVNHVGVNESIKQNQKIEMTHSMNYPSAHAPQSENFNFYDDFEKKDNITSAADRFEFLIFDPGKEIIDQPLLTVIKKGNNPTKEYIYLYKDKTCLSKQESIDNIKTLENCDNIEEPDKRADAKAKKKLKNQLIVKTSYEMQKYTLDKMTTLLYTFIHCVISVVLSIIVANYFFSKGDEEGT